MQINIFLFFVVVTSGFLFADETDRFAEELSIMMKTKSDSLFIKADELKKLALETGDKSHEAVSTLYIARYYDRNGINNKAITYYFLALEQFKELKYSNLNAFILSRVAASYRFLKDFEKSGEFFEKAFSEASPDDVKLRAKLLNQLGDINRDLGKIDSAFHFYHLSLEVAAGKDISAMANNYNNLGDLWREVGNYDSSAYFYNLSADILKNTDDIAELAENFTSLALLNYEHGYYDKAVEFISKSISMLENTSSYELNNAYEAAIEIYSKMRKLDSLSHYLSKLNALEKKLSNEKLSSSMMAIELEQNLKNKEAENSLLKQENEVKNLTNLLLLAVSASILLIGITLFLQIRRKKKENQLLTETNDKLNKANEELKKAYHDIHDLNATKDKFFSIISHDLKGPVSGMKLLLDIIIKDFNGFSQEELQDILREFYGLTDNTLQLLLTLLDWSRSQRGLLNVNFENIQIKRISEKNAMLLEKLASEKSITIIDNVAEDLTAEIDNNTIDTVMRNLISNAIKYTPRNGNIEIGANKIDHNTIEVYVKDTGLGISETIQNGLFKIGENKSTPGTNNEKGTGLGLLLCKDFVEKNGGSIRFESIQNLGTTFFFTIPIKQIN